jgi:hypothetical protein
MARLYKIIENELVCVIFVETLRATFDDVWCGLFLLNRTMVRLYRDDG